MLHREIQDYTQSLKHETCKGEMFYGKRPDCVESLNHEVCKGEMLYGGETWLYKTNVPLHAQNQLMKTNSIAFRVRSTW